MPSITLNDNELHVNRVTLSGRIRMRNGFTAGASGLLPTMLEIEREVAVNPVPDLFNRAIASVEEVNSTTLTFDLSVQEETAYTVSVEEGTVVGWSMSQEGVDDPVIETATVFARKIQLETDDGSVDLSVASSG